MSPEYGALTIVSLKISASFTGVILPIQWAAVKTYPVSEINSKLGYINYMQKTWKRPIGYSSHDENWEICILAFSLGAKVIERHITLDKNQFGLDHSTSSTPEEFKKLANIMANFDEILSGNSKREINQGELINLQN